MSGPQVHDLEITAVQLVLDELVKDVLNQRQSEPGFLHGSVSFSLPPSLPSSPSHPVHPLPSHMRACLDQPYPDRVAPPLITAHTSSLRNTMYHKDQTASKGLK